MRPLQTFLRACLLGFGLLSFTNAKAQQPLARFDLYTGFSDLNTPGLGNLNQVGFHLQAGVNLTRRAAAGFDYSIQNGSAVLTPALATTALQRELAAELPPGYKLGLPFSATTQTFTGGGQLVFRRYRTATFFVRPVLAAFHIEAVPHPADPIASLVSAQLAPGGRITDWVGAYGAGGGAEFPLSRWLGARVQFDAGWNHPFSNLLEHGHVSYRYSVGPAFHIGPKLHHMAARAQRSPQAS